MKPWKKLLLGLAGIFALTSLAACSSSTNTLDKVKNKGTLTVALNPHFAPFEFKTIQDGKDTIAGADIEIAKAIGDELGVKVKFSEMSFDNVLASVQSGKADIAISGISATKERQKIFDFSDTYYDSETVLLVKKDATETYKQISDFSKKSIAVQKGSIQENIAKANLSDANVVSLAQPGEAINELKSGQVEGVVLEKAIAKGYVDQNSDLTMSDIALKSDSNDAYAVAMPKGSDDLKAKVNKIIAKLKKEGKIDSCVQDAYALSLKSSSKSGVTI
ncbi:A0A249DKW8 (Amino acid ABC transportersubstrate-binding protein) [Streptococcus thermophilus]|uniref:transporter substrate-binding domain-containing protein n=1 Tax=Streptococcus thermophilus TaxID=1308 RepID=UPI000DC70E13|nr:transporter substrate-binding domain-containing protein [Streptococcus thermophilus]MBW7826196.1 transporter substrate-binding domain-containing protein [Streptococcus thermophilus]MCZ0707250.1 transporter substrate-binding domain-containing protein [Streptococcus thermophilus]MDA5404965.1 transporter substrate-binding domain-containing protein [Streptococcus thermophilus]MDA5412055.1 transporter substrate-binding domain-containing protein [Streptococcus thermophilus]MDA5452869.1 transporte